MANATRIGPIRDLQVNNDPGETYNIWVGDDLAAAGSKGMSVVAKPAEDSIVLQGATVGGANNQAIRLNPTGGDVQLGEVMAVHENGDVTTKSLTLTGDAAAPNLWLGGQSNTAQKGLYMWVKPDENSMTIQGMTAGGAFDQTIRINPHGADVQIGQVMAVHENGDVFVTTLTTTDDLTVQGDLTALNGHILGDFIVDGESSADSAAFNTCVVAGSDVRTFANTPDASYPPAGIAVSTGTAWDTPIAAADVPRLSAATNVFTGNLQANDATLAACSVDSSPVLTEAANLTLTTAGTSGPSTLVGKTLNIPNYAGGSGTVYPPAGVAVSTGVAWDLSINPATLAQTNTANTFTADQTVNGSVTATGSISANGSPVLTQAANLTLTTTGTSGPSTLTGKTLNIPQYTAPAQVYPAAGIAVSTGSAWGTAINPATLATYPAAGIPVSTGTAWGTPIAAADVPRLSTANTFVQAQTFSNNIGVSGDEYIAGISHLANGHILIGARTGAILGAQPSISTDNTNLYVGPMNNGVTYFNFDNQGNGVVFCDGLGGGTRAGSVDKAGLATFKSLAVSGSKSFVITHPLDETKDLYHACLEGPENGVYYRGEVVTVDGKAEVTLPDYFEALTFPDDRSVLLTVIVDDDNPVFGGQVAAGRIRDAKFKVYSTDPTATIAWEVKAVRRINVDRLQVVVDKYIPPAATTLPVDQEPPPPAAATTAGKPIQRKASKNVN